jgi:hypothetical protein
MDFFGAGSPLTQPKKRKENYWLSGPSVQAQIDEALAAQGLPRMTLEIKPGQKFEKVTLPSTLDETEEEYEARIEAAIQPRYGEDGLPLGVFSTDPEEVRTKPEYPSDGKTYVWNEPDWRWDLVEEPEGDLLEGEELVVIRNGEVISVGLNGRSLEDAMAEEMAIEGTEAVSENRRVTTIPVETPDITTFSPEQQEMYTTFDEMFGGLEGFEQAKEDFLFGVIDWLPNDFSYFNNSVPDASGIFQGGYATPNKETGEGNFYTNRSGSGYRQSFGTEPDDNPVDKAGNFRFIEQTTLDGRTIWTENDDFTSPGTQADRDAAKARTDTLVAKETAAAAALKGAEGATAILTRLVGAMGLPITVVSKLKAMMVDGLSEEAIKLEIRQTDEYKDRFPGMAVRMANGFSPITEAAYLQNEDTYYELLRLHGLPPRFYDDREDFASLIGQDVSPEEFSERVTLAELATAGADPTTKEELKRLYDVDEQDLVAYYLDPKSATNLIQERRAFEAAGLSATARRVAGQQIGFNKDVADALQREGVQRREIQQRLTPQAGLIGQTISETSGMSVSDLAAGEFGLNSDASRAVDKRRDERVSPFSGQAGTLVSAAGATGLGSST